MFDTSHKIFFFCLWHDILASWLHILSTDCFEGLISRCVYAAVKRRANGNIQIKEAKM